MPYTKVNPVSITTFAATYHNHDIETRRSVTGVLMFIYRNPIQWHNRRQNTVKISKHGLDMAAMTIATELTMAMWYKLRIIVVPIDVPSQIFGYNEILVTSFSFPYITPNNNKNAI